MAKCQMRTQSPNGWEMSLAKNRRKQRRVIAATLMETDSYNMCTRIDGRLVEQTWYCDSSYDVVSREAIGYVRKLVKLRSTHLAKHCVKHNMTDWRSSVRWIRTGGE